MIAAKGKELLKARNAYAACLSDRDEGLLKANDKITEITGCKNAAEIRALKTDELIDRAITELKRLTAEAATRDKSPSDELSIKEEALRLCNDQKNAERLEKYFGKDLLFVNGNAHCWNGSHWALDVTNEVAAWGRKLQKIVDIEVQAARAEADAANQAWQQTITPEQRVRAADHPRTPKFSLEQGPEHEKFERFAAKATVLGKWVNDCGMEHRQNAALRMLQKKRTRDPAELDRNQWLFNCPNGTIDLRTGTLRKADPADLITFCAPVKYNPDAKAPVFENFLVDIYSGDGELVKFAQRWFGYCLTGDTRDEKWVMHYGEGGNGKTKLVRTMQEIMGKYSGVAPITLLIEASRGAERHPTEIMTMYNKRMLTASEPDAGASLRQGLLKQTTGGDKVTGHHMYKDFVEFDPTHKTQLLTNSLPTVTTNERGTWRRLLVLAYQKTYGSPEEIAAGKAMYPEDPGLFDKLKKEYEGILAWAVRGCLEWQRQGLSPPAAVIRASRRYEEEQDRIGQFIEARCDLDPEARAELIAGTEPIYGGYKGWCLATGITPLGSNKFKKELTARLGIFEHRWDKWEGGRRTTARGLRGIRLKSESFPDRSGDDSAHAAAPAAEKPTSNGYDPSWGVGPFQRREFHFPRGMVPHARASFDHYKIRWTEKQGRNDQVILVATNIPADAVAAKGMLTAADAEIKRRAPGGAR